MVRRAKRDPRELWVRTDSLGLLEPREHGDKQAPPGVSVHSGRLGRPALQALPEKEDFLDLLEI